MNAETKSLSDLLSDRNLLDERIKEARSKELGDVLAKIKSLVVEFGLTVTDIFPTAQAQRKPVQPKYRDPATGQTWTGRGKPPAWTKGLNLEECRISG